MAWYERMVSWAWKLHRSHIILREVAQQQSGTNQVIQATYCWRQNPEKCSGKDIEGGSLHPNRKVRPDVYDRDVGTDIFCPLRNPWVRCPSWGQPWSVQQRSSRCSVSSGGHKGMNDLCSCVLLPTDCKSKPPWRHLRHMLGPLNELLMKMVISLFSCSLVLSKTP